MHTDEYEISIGREINLCERLIRGLKRSIRKREKRLGISTEDFLRALSDGRLSDTEPEFADWLKDCRDLRDWERMLKGYENVLEGLNEHASD